MAIRCFAIERLETGMKRAVPLLVIGIAAAATTSLFAQDMKNMDMGNRTAAPLPAAAPTVQNSKLTYARDIAPILAQNCQSCHRPGEGTPFSMTDYATVKRWAPSIKKAIAARHMPPWYEDGTTKKFENYRAMSK